MCVLRAGFRLVAPGAGIICRAIAAGDDLSRRLQRLLGDTQRVGTHVGDQTHGALVCDLHAFIELLRDHHCPARRHVELARGLLLERGRGERRRGIALFLRFFDALHRKRLLLHLGEDLVDLLLAVKLPLFRVAVIVRHKAAGLIRSVELGVDRPVFLRLEGTDLVFAVNDKARRDRLHTARGQTLAHFFPQQRAELIADDAVQHAPCLLRVDQILIDGARLGNGTADDVLRDLIEGHAHRPVVRNVQQIFEMPRDRLALAVRVSREVDVFAFFRAVAQILDDAFLARQRAVFRLEIMLDVHAERALGQISQVAHAGLDHVVRSEIFSDGLRFGGRLHDDQICLFLRHASLQCLFFREREASRG